MKYASLFAALGTAGLVALSQPALALQGGAAAVGSHARPAAAGGPKAANAQSFGSRATVNAGATMYGAFEVPQRTVVYILVRGNSLQTLGVTNNFLDAPRLRLYYQGADLIEDATGRVGTNYCVASNTDFNAAVVSYYRDVRRQPVQDRDACLALEILTPGAYTFTVTPSILGSTSSEAQSSRTGEVLFEITLNP